MNSLNVNSVRQRFWLLILGFLCFPTICLGTPRTPSSYPIVLRSLKVGVVTLWLAPSGIVRHGEEEQRLFNGTAISPSRMPGKGSRTFVGWAAGSISSTDGSLELNFVAQGPQGAPVYIAVTHHSDGTISTLARVPSKGVPKVCGTKHVISPITPPPSLYSADSSGKLVLNFSTEADALLSKRLGVSTNRAIARVVNSASAIYKRQFSLAIKIGAQRQETSNSAYPTRISDADQLLTRFQSRSLRSRRTNLMDDAFLFTSRKMNDEIVGLAYVGVVCSSVENSFGVVRLLNSAIDPVTTAHEIGHTLGGNHTSSGIMSAILSAPFPESFSPHSVSEISEYLNRYGQCLRN